MDNEQLLEAIKNEKHKLDIDLKVKTENEKHLIYENETLMEENNKLLEMCSQNKLVISKLETKTRKLEGDLENLSVLENINEDLIKENDLLKINLDEQVKINKELQKSTRYKAESPSVKLRQLEYKYKCEIEKLNDENKMFETKILMQDEQMMKLKNTMVKDQEFSASKIDSYKKIIAEIREEKEELQCENIQLKNEIDKPDFNRQGNNMYVEVEDRRILAETRVLEYQIELRRLSKENTELKVYLEKSFEAYSDIKNDEFTQRQRIMLEENIKLSKLNHSLQNQLIELNQFVTDELSKYKNSVIEESTAVRSLRLQCNLIRRNKTDVDRELSDVTQIVEQKENKLLELYKRIDQSMKDNLDIKIQLDEAQNKLDWLYRIIPKDKLTEYEEQQKKVEELLEADMAKNPAASSDNGEVPMQIFGQYYQSAKFSDKLVFDPFGKIIENKLTRKIMNKIDNDADSDKKPLVDKINSPSENIDKNQPINSALKEVNTNCAPMETVILPKPIINIPINLSSRSRSSVSIKENIEPRRTGEIREVEEINVDEVLTQNVPNCIQS